MNDATSEGRSSELQFNPRKSKFVRFSFFFFFFFYNIIYNIQRIFKCPHITYNQKHIRMLSHSQCSLTPVMRELYTQRRNISSRAVKGSIFGLSCTRVTTTRRATLRDEGIINSVECSSIDRYPRIINFTCCLRTGIG